MSKYDITLDDCGLHIGSKTFVGECVSEDLVSIGRALYDTKIYHYSNGKCQIAKCNQRKYRVPVPGALPKVKKHSSPLDDNSAYRSDREDNLLRARSRMFQIMLSNEWDYFVTFTFDDSKVEAANVSLVIQKLQRWLKNIVQRNGIGYLLVPEYHKKDKRVHVHAIVKGKLDLSFDEVYAVQGLKKPVKAATIKKYGIAPDRVKYPVYNVQNWRYGFSTAIPIYGSLSRLANYCLKYMTKDTERIFGRSYWCSKNIQLYPVIEMRNDYDYYQTNARPYYHRGSDAEYKYINHLGDAILDMADDEVVITTA